MMTAVEQIVWAAWRDHRNTVEIAHILNKIPEALCGRSDLYSEAECHRILTRLKDCEYVKKQRKLYGEKA